MAGAAATVATVEEVHHVALMGDLITSRSSESISETHKTFNAVIDAENRSKEAALASLLTITLGDEFQGLFYRLAPAVLTARSIRLKLLKEGIGCRFVVGYVSIATPLHRENAWNMMGPGLAEVRTILNEKKSGGAYKFYIPESRDMENVLNASGSVLSAMEDDWTARQLQVVVEMLKNGGSVGQAAEKLGVKHQTVSKAATSANFSLYKKSWLSIVSALEGLDGDQE